MKIRKLLQLGSASIVGLSSLLALNLGTALAVANNCTWTGTNSNNFNDAGNWSSCNSTVPQAGDNLVFDNSSLGNFTTLNNDMTGLSVGSISFNGTGDNAYTVSGNSLTVTNGINNDTTQSIEIDSPLTFTGSQVLDATGSEIILGGAISGSGNLTLNGGTVVLVVGNPSYGGNIDAANNSTLQVDATGSLGDTTGTTTVESGSQLLFYTNGTVAEPLILDSSGPGGDFNNFALGGSGDLTLSGAITLSADTTVEPGVSKTDTLTMTGPLAGAFKLSVGEGDYGKLVVSSSNNTSSTANGTYEAPKISHTLSDSQSGVPVSIGYNQTYVIDGTRQSIYVDDGGTLKGTGTVADTTVASGGTVAPGHSPGCLSTGDLLIEGTYQAELGGTTACSGYDQLKVTGSVDVTDGTLTTSLYKNFKPKAGDKFTIISNDGKDKVTGTFKGLAEGATFKLSGYVFKISYKGGTGNDVVLTVQSVPTTPDTGFAFTGANPAATLIGTLAATGTLLVIGRKTKLAFARR